jgi:hypothetical protein
MRRLLLTTLILVLPAAGKYRGNVTDDAGKVTFEVVGNKLKRFRIDEVGAVCPDGFLLVRVRVVATKIRRDGTFHKRYRPNPERDQWITLDGRFHGRRATGTVTGGPRCEYQASWTARHV